MQTPWGGALLLRNGERISRYWGADHEVAQLAVVNGRRQTVKQKRRGYLVLTTQRLAFVQERGVFGKSYHIDLSFPLDTLGGLSMGGIVMKYVSISDTNGENVFHVQGVGNEVEFATFRTLIQNQLVEMQQEIEAEKRRDRIQITLDFSFLRDYMSKGGLSVQVVKCPQCGAPISLPKEGTQTTCEHCGSTVFAQDIMEKVKQLIG
jgi:DNA-directed RNA polymerase subunit RPC12/RpoP